MESAAELIKIINDRIDKSQNPEAKTGFNKTSLRAEMVLGTDPSDSETGSLSHWTRT